MNILIIDDEPKIRNGLSKLLSARDESSVQAFESAQSALTYLYEHEVDVIITDICMPEMSGLEMLERIREVNKEVDVIILSGYSRFDYAQKAIELGVRKYMTKPTDVSLLQSTLDTIERELSERKAKLIEQFGAELDKEQMTPSRSETDEKTAKQGEGMNLLTLRAMQYIDEHFAEKLSLKNVAEALYISPNYLSDLFSKTTGTRFSEYILSVRMEKSKHYLSDVKYKVSEVAELVGFSDSHYFSSTFKKMFGMTPNEFRNKTYKNDT